MGFLERAIRRGVSDAVSKAIGGAVQKAVEPKATELANKAAESIDKAAGNARQTAESAEGLEGAMARLQRSAENYTTEAAKSIKICPECGKPAAASEKFCPECGKRLPDTTVAQMTLCTACGKQNSVNTKFCTECGEKLPATVAEENAKTDRDAALMKSWETMLPQYPKWACGGSDFNLETIDGGYIIFSASFDGESNKAHQAVRQYRELLVQNGFRQAGEHPSVEHLYKKNDGVCFHVDTEHCFDGDGDCPIIGFNIQEPVGGYDYVKPEPKKKTGLFGLFK